jgi:DNA-directed RNA polymerase subunit RPC12/RpoP
MIVDTCPTCDQIVDEEDILKSTQNLFGSACVDCGDNFNSIHNGEYEIVTLVIQREEDLSVSVRCNDCHLRNMMK